MNLFKVIFILNFFLFFESIKLNTIILFFPGDTLKFCARPLQLKLPNLNLSDLGIDSEIFWREGSAPVKLDVCVLPHLHQATATYVYSKLPSSSPFKGYNDVKVYWERLVRIKFYY